MKQRSPVSVFLLSIVTLGIYDLYWLMDTKKVLNQTTKHHVPTIWLLVGPWILVIAGYIVLFASSTPTTTSTDGYYGSTTSQDDSSISALGLIAFLVIILGFFVGTILNVIWYYRYSKAVDAYTHGKMSTAVGFLILYLIHLIGVALIQDAFNSTDETGAQPHPAAANNPQALASHQTAADNQHSFAPQHPQQPQTNPMPPTSPSAEMSAPPQHHPSQPPTQTPPTNQF